MAGQHDDLSFDQLKREYNFLNISSYPRVLTNLILGELSRRPGPTKVLDVGCGKGIGRSVELQEEVGKLASEFWGIEPDTSVPAPSGLFTNYQHALMETAVLPENYFDIVYSSMVMEHVEKPEDYLQAVKRCLKPGGVHLFLTPNANSFVPRVTKLCHQLKLDEFALKLVRRQDTIEEYHYPVQFRFNTPRTIDRFAERFGFLPPEYAYIEGTGARSYFPGPFRIIYNVIKMKRNIIKNPRRLATMICRMELPS